MYAQYLDEVCRLLQRMKEKQAAGITKAAGMVGDTIIAGGLVYTFGSGHSQLLSQEVSARAGGLYPVMQIPDPMWGRAERIEGFAEVLLKGLPLKGGETIFVISNSGRNPEPIEIAMQVKQMGLHVIAVCSLAHSRKVTSRHSSGKKLYELGDVVLDTGTPAGDAALKFKGMQDRAGAVSTVLGATLMNAVMVEAIQYMLDRGYDPPVLNSANLDGSDEHNAKVMARYAGQISSMFGMH